MKRLAGLLMAAACAPISAQSPPPVSPATAQSYENAELRIRAKLDQTPDNSELRVMLARTLAQQKKFDAAIAEYRLLQHRAPQNVDYAYAIGMLHVWRGAPSKGLQELDRARNMAPDYEEIWAAQINTLELHASDVNRKLAAILRRQAARQFPNSGWQTTPPPVATGAVVAASGLKIDTEIGAAQKAADRNRRTTVEVNASVDRLSDGRDSWAGLTLQMTHRIAERHLVAAALRETRRFGLRDAQVELSYSMPLTARLTGTLDGSYSSSHRVLPQRSVGASLQYEIVPAWFVHGGIRNTQYDHASVNQATLMLEHYFSSYRWATAWRPTRALGTTAQSAEFRFDYYYSDLSSVGVTLSAGRDAATVDGPVVVVSDVRSIVVNGRHWLNREWAMHYEVGSTRRGDSYTKTGVLIGVQHAF